MLHSIDENGNTAHICPHCQNKNEYHINHSEMEWMADADLIGMPHCDCGSRTFVKTRFTPQELAEPIIHRDEYGKIASVQILGAPNLWPKISHLEKNEAGEIIEVIDAVVQHPAIAKHRDLADQLYALQKYPVVQTSTHADDGVVQWQCPGCSQPQSAHVSHPEMIHVETQGTIALPACSCGVRVAIKVEQPQPQPVRMLLAGQGGPVMVEGLLAEHAEQANQHQKFLERLKMLGKLLQGQES